MFIGRNLLIATKHEKERLIAPILEKELGVKCFVAFNLDTDKLGTFTGEFERKDNPINTARKKCLMAMELNHCDLAIASEGSFGPHPSLPFITADDEFLLFMDKKNNLEIVVREISSETNFKASVIQTESELNDFASKVNFPSHGLILRKSKDDYSNIVKGITNFEELNSVFYNMITSFGKVYVETDMRAMHNPTRMKVIERATNKLAKKINTYCPICQMPGFGITEAKQGLPCLVCNFPTRSDLSHVFFCQKCYFKKEEKYPHGKHYEEPVFCNVCNP